MRRLFLSLLLATLLGCSDSPSSPSDDLTGVWEGTLTFDAVASSDPCVLEDENRRLPRSHRVTVALEQNGDSVRGSILLEEEAAPRLVEGTASGGGLSLVSGRGDCTWDSACTTETGCLRSGTYAASVSGRRMTGSLTEDYRSVNRIQGRVVSMTLYGSLDLLRVGEFSFVGFTPESAR